MLSAVCLVTLFSAADYISYSADLETNRLVTEFMRQSYPPDPATVTLINPWGERLQYDKVLPPDFGSRCAAAARMYAWQMVRFDGYFGSDDDGGHYLTAADGKDGAYYGNPVKKSYNVIRNRVADDLRERVWICLDLPVHSIAMAGFPLREALASDFAEAKFEYTIGGSFAENVPTSHHFFRRIRNVQLYFQRKQHYAEHRITKEQYRDPKFRPPGQYRPGDLVFFGHYGDPDGEKGWWRAQHTGIVGTVDGRGLPVRIYNMRVSQGLIDEYDGAINQSRPVGERQVFFKKFSDRYSLIGLGRVVNPFVPAPPETSGDSTTTGQLPRSTKRRLQPQAR